MHSPDVEPRPLDYARRERPTAYGELGKIVRGVAFLFSFIRPFVFAAGLGFLMYGLGASLESRFDGPDCMGIGGVLVGISLPWWRVST